LLVGEKCLHRDYGDDLDLSSPNLLFAGLGGKMKMAQGQNLEPYNFGVSERLIYLQGGKVIETTENLKDIERRLDKRLFRRIHKGYIVNLNMIISAAPFGKATYELKLANTKETALTTAENFRIIKKMFGMND